jgi:hypothetical protein
MAVSSASSPSPQWVSWWELAGTNHQEDQTDDHHDHASPDERCWSGDLECAVDFNDAA